MGPRDGSGSATTLAIVGPMLGAIVSRLQTIATFAAAPLVPAPLPQLNRVGLLLGN